MEFRKPIFNHDIREGTWDLDKELFLSYETFNNDQIVLSDGPDSYILDDIIKTVTPNPNKYSRSGIIFRNELYPYKDIFRNTKPITINLVCTPDDYKSPERTNTFDYQKFSESFINDKRLHFYNYDLNSGPYNVFFNFSIIDLLEMPISIGLEFSDDLSKADIRLYYYSNRDHMTVYHDAHYIGRGYEVTNKTMLSEYIPLYDDNRILYTIDYNNWNYEDMMSLIIEQVRSWMLDNGVRLNDFRKNHLCIIPFVEVVGFLPKRVRIR
jgi:hypothetical protein